MLTCCAVVMATGICPWGPEEPQRYFLNQGVGGGREGREEREGTGRGIMIQRQYEVTHPFGESWDVGMWNAWVNLMFQTVHGIANGPYWFCGRVNFN